MGEAAAAVQGGERGGERKGGGEESEGRDGEEYWEVTDRK